MEQKPEEGVVIKTDDAPQSGRRRPKIEKKQELLFKVTSMSDIIDDNAESCEKFRKVLGNIIAEGDITLFWGPAGTGKSAFGYQIAEAIGSGKDFFNIPLDEGLISQEEDRFRLSNTIQPSEKVLYVDFEMGPEKLAYRYKGYKPSKNIKVMHFENYAVNDKTAYIEVIRKVVDEQKYKFVIIDNLSNLITESEKGDRAATFMNTLKQMAKDYSLTLIVLNHSNKFNRLDRKTPDQMKGNAQLTNFADSVFAISAATEGKNVRYLIQQKCRYGQEQFGDDNVIKMDLIKMKNGFLGFAFAGYGKESSLLNPDIVKIEDAILSVLSEDIDMSCAEIARKLNDLYGNKEKNLQDRSFERRINYYVKKYDLRMISKLRKENKELTL